MKKINKIIIFALVLTLLGRGAAQALAAEEVTALPAVPAVTTVAPVAEVPEKQIDKETVLKRLIKRGENLIIARVNSLNGLKKRVAANKLTDAQKIELTAMVDENINGLNNLKAQIQAGTDIKAARELVKSIYANFRIYAVFIPKAHLIIALDRLQNHLDNIGAVAEKIQAGINKAKEKGKDVSKRQAALDSALSMKTDIQAKIIVALEAAKSLKPADYPDTYKQKISDVRAKIKEIVQLLNKQRAAARAK